MKLKIIHDEKKKVEVSLWKFVIISSDKKLIIFCVRFVLDFVYEIWCIKTKRIDREMMSSCVHEIATQFCVVFLVMK